MHLTVHVEVSGLISVSLSDFRICASCLCFNIITSTVCGYSINGDIEAKLVFCYRCRYGRTFCVLVDNIPVFICGRIQECHIALTVHLLYKFEIFLIIRISESSLAIFKTFEPVFIVPCVSASCAPRVIYSVLHGFITGYSAELLTCRVVEDLKLSLFVILDSYLCHRIFYDHITCQALSQRVVPLISRQFVATYVFYSCFVIVEVLEVRSVDVLLFYIFCPIESVMVRCCRWEYGDICGIP